MFGKQGIYLTIMPMGLISGDGSKIRVLAAFQEYPVWVPNTHVSQLTTSHNSSSGDLIPSAGLHGHLFLGTQYPPTLAE